MAQFIFKNASVSNKVADLRDWQDFGQPAPDWYGNFGRAVELEPMLVEVQDIFNGGNIVNGKPDPMIFDSFVDFM